MSFQEILNSALFYARAKRDILHNKIFIKKKKYVI